MSLNSKFETAKLRPLFNLGALQDIPTGRYLLGAKGESMLSGGASHLDAVVGRGNMFKSTISWFRLLRIMQRYSNADGQAYDTELTSSIKRVEDLCRYGMADLIPQLDARFRLTDRLEYTGSEWYKELKDAAEEREKNKIKPKLTPFFDPTDESAIYMHDPYLCLIDSFSMFFTDNILKIQEKEEAGAGGRQTEAMRDANAKTQLLLEWGAFNTRNNVLMCLTAHVGDEYQLDPYKPNQKRLAYLNNGKLKNVPEKFTFLTHVCLDCRKTQPLINATTKAPEYPASAEDDRIGDTDLNDVSIQYLRNKYGQSGAPFNLIVSQTQGVLPEMSEFYYLHRGLKGWGLGGNDRNYFLDLVPDVNLSRTTVRRKITESAQLRRGLEISSELGQMHALWRNNMPKDLLCTPKQLFEDLSKKYDWNVLLNTRGYWTFDQYENPLPFLSTMDLLRMRVGEYHPFWMK